MAHNVQEQNKNEPNKNLEVFVENGFKNLINATKKSNQLPFGKGRNFYESYPVFHTLVNKVSEKVLTCLSLLLKHGGYRSAINKGDDDEKIEMIIEANDSILGKVGRILDELSGICKYPEPEFVQKTNRAVSGAWNVNGSQSASSTTQMLSNIIKHSKNMPKPQVNFKDVIDNDRNTLFTPKIKYKHNLLKPLAIMEEVDEAGNVYYSHPYQFELEHFKPPQEQLTKVQPKMYKTFDETPINMVKTPEEVKSMISELKKHKEIAVDVENNAFRSFQGITCLLQISTRNEDYIIDTFAVRNDLEDLNQIFTDPQIVKVFHGADLDLLWLQRDLGLYVVNLFDTYEASKCLGYPRLSYAFLVQKFCDIIIEKSFQLADWRIRPLPQPFIDYARGDTHYLLYIYDNLKNLLIEKGNGLTNHLESVISISTSKCLMQVYKKPPWDENGFLELYNRCKKLFDNRQKYALKHLYDWRDRTARKEDESYAFVLPNHMLLQISEALPREMQGIMACCSPVPPLVSKYLLALHEIILKAREQPLIEPVFSEREFYRATGENNLVNLSSLRCPHDLNHVGEFRNDLPVLISNGSSDVDGKEDLIASSPTVNVFEQLNCQSEKLPVLPKGIVTPYQRYKLSKPFSETKMQEEIEAQKIVSSNKEKIEQMEVNSAQSMLKKEPEESNVPTESLRKRKSAETRGKSEKVPPKKVKTEERDAVPNSNANATADPPKEEKKNKKNVKPFDYSSVDYNNYQTYANPKKEKKKHSKRFKKSK